MRALLCVFAGLWKCAEPASWTKRMLHTFVWVPSGVTYSSATIQEWFASGMSRDHNSSSSGFGCASSTTGSTSFWGKVPLYSVSVVFFCYLCKISYTYIHTHTHTHTHAHTHAHVHAHTLSLSLSLSMLQCHSWVLLHWLVNCWKFLCQHRVYFYDNKIGWHLVCEDDAYSLY